MHTPRPHGHAHLTVIAAVVCACWISIPAVPQTVQDTVQDIDTLMTRVGGRLENYYRRAQTVIGVERSTVQPIRWNWTTDGLARTVESEVRVESAVDGVLLEPRLVRSLRRVNGRAPREPDYTDRAGCTDPEAASPDPLAFLLPPVRDEYQFFSVADGSEQDRSALIIAFKTKNRTSRPELVEDPRGHPDCFDWTGPVARRGRLWVDANTFEVLRLERHNEGPVEVRVSWRLQRSYNLSPWLVVDRDDLTVHYKPVAFDDPDEVILLPASLTALTIVRSGLQSIRRTETFTNYRRFLTTGRVKSF